MNQRKQRLWPTQWFWYGIGVMLLVWALDQALKGWILSVVDPSHSYYVTSFFNLALTWNRGIAFGMFASGETSPLILIGVAGVISLAILFYLWQSQRLIESLSLGLILGGAMGNVTDRWQLGAVVDFLDFHLGRWHWPAFNLADSAICLGVAMIMVSLLWPSASSASSQIPHDQ